MRSAKEAGRSFPYDMDTMCYMEVLSDATVTNTQHKMVRDREGLQEVYERVKTGASKLYAAWPGNYSTDLFEIDDLEAFAKAFGLDTGAPKHIHSFTWKKADYQFNEGSFVSIEVRFACGCYQQEQIDIREFAGFANHHLGWEVVTGTAHGTQDKRGNRKPYSYMRVRAKYLKGTKGEFNMEAYKKVKKTV